MLVPVIALSKCHRRHVAPNVPRESFWQPIEPALIDEPDPQVRASSLPSELLLIPAASLPFLPDRDSGRSKTPTKAPKDAIEWDARGLGLGNRLRAQS